MGWVVPLVLEGRGHGGTASIASGAFTPAVPWIAADTKGLFWNVPGSGNGVKDGAIMTLMANEAAAIVTEQPGPEGVALDAGHVYWANCGDDHAGR
jgi:hypothetical protein